MNILPERIKGRYLAKSALIVAATAMLASCGIIGGDDGPKTTPTVGKRIPVLSRVESGAEVDPSLAGTNVIYPAPVANSGWTQPGGNAAKAMGHVSLGANLSQAWSASVAGSTKRVRLAAAPVAEAGRVYLIDTSAVVHAYDAGNGGKVWSTGLRVEGDGQESVFGGGVSIDGARVFATNGVGEVAALNSTDGSIIWKVKPAGPLRGAPTLAFNSVLVMTQDNQLYSLNAADGSVQWNKAGSLGQAGVFGVAAPAAGQGTILAGYSSGELNAYRYENGRDVWGDALSRTSISTSVATLSDIDADPIINQGRVYALGQGGRMAAYELITGQRIWELNIAGISTPAISGEWIFTLTDDGRMLCIARSTGKVRWIAKLPKFRNEEKKKDPILWTGPVLAGGRLIVASTQGGVVSISTGEGSISTLFNLGESVSLPPMVADNTLYILDDSGRLTAFR
ncbi:PQQ-binding-like beta-propeller repeat protein [Sphingorhabdus sp. Alg239-R122]|uniref:PQQ-like beta-propeller repeat protein n=1 Tax=Sphingorhabdus sp. Alg239-R122 TaxID=2305989 RepID=UPI0013DBB4CB|nr:PQQ-binding-like beta-propeller repeat protein [Sphingorhabdus sp. Alg239-R122]